MSLTHQRTQRHTTCFLVDAGRCTPECGVLCVTHHCSLSVGCALTLCVPEAGHLSSSTVRNPGRNHVDVVTIHLLQGSNIHAEPRPRHLSSFHRATIAQLSVGLCGCTHSHRSTYTHGCMLVCVCIHICGAGGEEKITPAHSLGENSVHVSVHMRVGLVRILLSGPAFSYAWKRNHACTAPVGGMWCVCAQKGGRGIT